MLAGGARPDERHRNAERRLDERDVLASGAWEPVVDVLAPSRQHLEDRPTVVEVALVRREVLGLGVVRKPVAHAHRQLGELGEDVELGQGK